MKKTYIKPNQTVVEVKVQSPVLNTSPSIINSLGDGSQLVKGARFSDEDDESFWDEEEW